MLLRLQKYSLRVTYKKGHDMFLANTLSIAFLPEFTQAVEDVDHRASLPVSYEHWQQIRHESADDTVLQHLHATIRRGWPETKSETPECIYPYFDIRDVFTIQNKLIFKGQLLVVPAALRKELMAVVHSSYIAIEGCIRRARDTLYCPTWQLSSESTSGSVTYA